MLGCLWQRHLHALEWFISLKRCYDILFGVRQIIMKTICVDWCSSICVLIWFHNHLHRWSVFIIQACQAILNISLPRGRWLALVVSSALRWELPYMLFSVSVNAPTAMLYPVILLSLIYYIFGYAGSWRLKANQISWFKHNQIYWCTQDPVHCPIIWWLRKHCGPASIDVLLVISL